MSGKNGTNMAKGTASYKYCGLVRVIHDDMPSDMGACVIRISRHPFGRDAIAVQVNYIVMHDSGEPCVLEEYIDIASDTHGCFTDSELDDIGVALSSEPEILSDIKSIKHSIGFKETISADGRLYAKSVNMIEWRNEEDEVIVHYDKAVSISEHGRVVYQPTHDIVNIDEFLNSDRYVYITGIYHEAKRRAKVMNKQHYHSDTIDGVFITFEEGI